MSNSQPMSLKQQRGWSLVETAVSTMLLAVMLAGIAMMMRPMQERTAVRTDQDLIVRADAALAGFALTHSRLPTPEDARESPGRPGYVEGWLPAAQLHMPGAARRVRYIVETVLSESPAIYNPDPFGLTQGLVAVRTAPNGLDFCAALRRSAQSATLRSSEAKWAYGMRSADGSETPGAEGFWPLEAATSVMNPVEDSRPHAVLARGQGELLADLGCIGRMVQLDASVKAVAAAQDFALLGDQEVQFRQQALKAKEEALTMAEWRHTNKAMQVASFSTSMAMVPLASELYNWVDPVGSALGITQFSFLIASASESLRQLDAARSAQEEGVVSNRDKLKDAGRKQQDLHRFVKNLAATANASHERGLNP